VGAGRRVQAQPQAAHLDHDVGLGDLLAVGDGGGQHLHHAGVALDRGHRQRLLAAGAHAREQPAHGRQQHVGLAQRRQHLLDVAQEGRVGPDHQHPAPGQTLAVGVEQVGGPVQGHGSLAGARPALDDQHAGKVGSDDAVLLGLDGGHDVLHPAGAAGREGGQQGRLAGEALALGLAQRLGVEHVVLDPQDGAAAGAQVPAADHAGRGGPGGPVERLGRGGAPVDQQRFPVVVEQSKAADVQVAAVGAVEPPEAQAVLGRVQLGQAAAVPGHEGVPVDPGLDVAAAVIAQGPLQLGPGALAQGVEAPVQQRHVGLFLFQLSGEILHP
jgi:hypothetical protein